ncbi:unnamed protein product [Anisakis simplex]|uniref:Tudor domain-containing protein n=1 Tax=Anisakis simplex TaxID=6269 RepID=A0A0M3IYM5_ANISI|nr:unnamed protein product [Anisakis simplex]
MLYFFFISSDHLPVMLSDLVVQIYDDQFKPSCLNNRPNIVLPGYALLLKGQLNISKKFELKNHTFIKMTVVNSDGTLYCKNGESVMWFIPADYCLIDLCEFIGDKLCSVLGRPGMHTVKELMEKAHFNPKLQLPEPPCFMMVCLTDFFGGDWTVLIAVEYRGKVVFRFKVPSREKFLQVAADQDYDQEQNSK